MWKMGSETNPSQAVKNMKTRLEQNKFILNKKLLDKNISALQPFSNVNYRPELDTSVECTGEQISICQNLIGILRWLVKLGRIDIGYKVYVLSRYLVQPKTGHLNQVFHILNYLGID